MITGRRKHVDPLPLLALLAVFLLVSSGLMRESLWYDEARSMWVVRPPGPIDMLSRLDCDVHPPLYFFLLDAWVALVGESAYAARMLSTAFAMLGLAATYAVGKRLFDRWTAWMAVAVLGTAGVFIYYAREARMYSLMLCLGALSMWACVRWLRRPTLARSVSYGLLMAAFLYTHYYAVFFILTQALYVLLVRPRYLARWLAVAVLALALFALWMPGLLQQAHAHFDGALDPSQPTDWWTVCWMVAVLTGGAWWLQLAPFVLGRALVELRRYRGAILLLLLWLLVTPLAALTLNLWVPLFYHARYLIAILPAGALLVAYGLRRVFWRPLACLLLLALACAQLVAFDRFWPDKPPWEPAVRRMVAARRPEEPSLIYIADCCVEAYYDRQYGIRNESALDLSSRRHSPAEVREIVSSLDAAPAVWLIMPANLPETWDAIWALAAERRVGYRDGVELMFFYRFDREGGDDPRFRFGDLLRYDGGLVDPTSVRQGEQVCAEVDLTALASVDGSYSAGVHLVNPVGALVAQADEGIGVLDPGEQVSALRCLHLPADIEPGDYSLHLVIYNWATIERLPVVEGGADGVFWGDALVFSKVTVAK
ncbi:MAG: glycosyltransferase family 39 protein [Anaerolineae bacterium]|nr:glycosyltransferase family 39 protein [Anaerolineae bacterium]